MNFFIIVGAQATGKMTVGKELRKQVGAKLFHNHMSIEMPLQIFDYDSSGFKRLNQIIRTVVFEESRTLNQDLIFTYVCAFNEASDIDYLNNLINDFEKNNHNVYVVELESDLSVRIERNKTPERLFAKESKRNITESEKRLLEFENSYRMISLPGEIKCNHYLRVNNTDCTAKQVAELIVDTFNIEVS